MTGGGTEELEKLFIYNTQEIICIQLITLTPKPVPAVASSDCTPFVVCILMKIYSFRSRLQIVSVLTITDVITPRCDCEKS